MGVSPAATFAAAAVARFGPVVLGIGAAQRPAPGIVPEESAMETEITGWKWVLRSVVETAVLVLALSVLGTLTLKLVG